MSALYRTYRPQKFADVLGQDHLNENIKNSLKKGTINHAYLFSGPRGTGKTTTARLLARAVNCLNLTEDGEPCGKCAICREIIDNRSTDIIEIDGASNNGIDEIRELRDKVAYAPSSAKFKVYIIDEVHMLSTAAFNGLLKTLEEPPAHVIFILATTELHKVPGTIISRTQRYQFHRASDGALNDLLKKITKAEKMKLSAEAIALIAERAEGSFRDALTLLDNVGSQGENIDETSLRDLLGLPQKAVVASLREQLLLGKPPELINSLRQSTESGADILILTKAVTDSLKKDILTGVAENMAQTTQLLEDLLVVLARTRNSADPIALLIAQLYDIAVKNADTPNINRSATTASKPASTSTVVPNEGKVAPAQIAPAETKTAEEPVKIVMQKSEVVTGKVDATYESVAVPVAVVENTPSSAAPSTNIDELSQPEESPTVDAVTAPAKSHNQAEFWQLLLSEIKNDNHAIYMVLRSAELEDLSDEKFVIAVRFRFYSERLYELKNKKIIEKAAEKVSGRLLHLECLVRTDVKVSQEVKAEEDLLGAVVDVFEIET